MPYSPSTYQRRIRVNPTDIPTRPTGPAATTAPQTYTSSFNSLFMPAPQTTPQTSGGKSGGGKKNGLAAYLGTDDQYMNTLNDLMQNFGAFKSTNTGQKVDLRQDFGVTRDRLKQAQAEANRNLAEEYAARGTFGTGMFGQVQGRSDLDYLAQNTDAAQSFDRNMTQLKTDLANARRLFIQNREDARLAAIRRRAEKLGIQ